METGNVLCFSDKVFENLIFFPMAINGIEVTAIFDTGAGMSFVSQSIADQFEGLQIKPSVNAGNNQGIMDTYKTACVNSITIGDVVLTGQNMGILPDEALDFGEDSRHNLFPASMFLGWDIISQFCWEIDMNKRTVKVYPGGIMPKSSSLSWDSFPVISISYAGSDYQVGFDCGHTDSFLDVTWATRLNNLKEAATVTYGVGSSSGEEVKIIDEFSFVIDKANITLYNIEIVQHQIYGTADGQICGLLGADILCGAKWIIDYQSRYFSIGKYYS